MIAHANTRPEVFDAPAWHEGFLTLLPTIQTHAARCLRRLRPEKREEVIAEVVANCLVAYRRLAERGKEDLAYPSVLVRFAIAQYFAGRRVGGSMNVKDVCSDERQTREGFHIKQVGSPGEQQSGWREQLVENRVTPVPDQAAFRIDFPAWLRGLTSRNRRIAVALARGHRTEEVARQNRLSPGRISQLRRELAEDWSSFHGERLQPAQIEPSEHSDQSAFNRSLAVYDEALA